jgi:hypothetical protein
MKPSKPYSIDDLMVDIVILGGLGYLIYALFHFLEIF